jgi:alpha-tubulin suppressor-like RCC1 family protein
LRSKTFCLVGCLLLSSALWDCVSRGDTNVNTRGSEAGSTASSSSGKGGSGGKGSSGATHNGGALSTQGGAPDDGETPSNGGSANGGTSPSKGGSAGTVGEAGQTGSDPGTACEASLVAPSRIASGGLHTCAISGTGVMCWGENSLGQLGVGEVDAHPLPVMVAGLEGSVVVGVAAGGGHSCALLEDGTARCWGQNTSGQLGTGDTVQSLEPLPVVGLKGAVALSAGDSHTCAILADGSAKCWGLNGNGEIGKGDSGPDNVLAPTAVSNLKGVIQMASGANHTCAVLSDCTAKCWGSGAYGQIGNNGNGVAVIPTTVLDVADKQPLTGVVGLGAGVNHTCAILKSGGGVKCWGENSFQQAAGPQAFGQPLATQVDGLSGTTDVAGGRNYTCARRSNGSVRCWGSRSYGMLGDGVVEEGSIAATPVLLTHLGVAAEITAGTVGASKHGFTCALLADKSAACWGRGDYYQQGSGTAADQLTPFPVQNFP